MVSVWCQFAEALAKILFTMSSVNYNFPSLLPQLRMIVADHLLGCLYEPAAEPTNNRAERALRPAVIARKVSCGNKTERGRYCWQILSSIGATCQQQTVDFVEYLSSHLPLTATPG